MKLSHTSLLDVTSLSLEFFLYSLGNCSFFSMEGSSPPGEWHQGEPEKASIHTLTTLSCPCTDPYTPADGQV